MTDAPQRSPRRQRWTERARDRRDAGFTLVEVLIAVVLSSAIGGVTIAAMLTSMNVADVTTEQIAGSNDTGQIAAWFTRDAQAAGSTAPSTGRADPQTGISVDTSAEGWQGCLQPGVLVVRFSWTDRVDIDTSRRVVVTYAQEGTRLSRRSCADGTSATLTLAEHVATSTVECDTGPSCAGSPDRISLHVTGSADRVPAEHTFTASLRHAEAPIADASTTASVPLAVFGGSPGACPAVQLTGTGVVDVRGDAMVGTGCGTALGGDPSRLHPTGVLSEIDGALADPLVALPAPSGGCGGANPAVLGISAAPDDQITHPQPVTVSGPLHLQPGRYVFCAGLALAPNAVVDGTDVVLVVTGGQLTVAAGAQIDLTAPTTGALANVAIWSRSAMDADLQLTSGAVSVRGLLYVPDARVVMATEGTASLGGVVAGSATFSGGGTLVLGRP